MKKKLETIVPTFVKTTSMKVINDSIVKLNLFKWYSEFTVVASNVKNIIYDLGKNGDTKYLYDDYVKQSNRGRAATTTLFTKLSLDKQYKKKDRPSFPEKHRSAEVFPIYDESMSSYNFNKYGHSYAVNASVHSQLNSLNECQVQCSKEFNALKTESERLKVEILKKHSEAEFNAFFTLVSQNVILGFQYNFHFVKFFEQKMHPELIKGKTIYKGIFKLSNGNGKRFYFYNNVIADQIASRLEFWDMFLNEDCLNYFLVKEKLMFKKEFVSFTPISLCKSQVRPLFGNNVIKFNISTSIDNFVYLDFMVSKTKDKTSEKMSLKCSYRKYYENGKMRKSCYLDGLTIQPNGDGKYICKYSINGKHDQEAKLNECCLRLKIRNHRYFNKLINNTLTPSDGPLKASYFDFYIDLSLGITEEPINDLTSSEVFGKSSLRSFYSSALPVKLELGNQTSLDNTKFECPVKKPHNVIGIDLGQRNPFAYCVLTNDGKLVSNGHMVGSSSENYKKYIEFGNDCEKVKQLIHDTRNFLCSDDDEAIDRENFNESVKLINNNLTYENYIEYLKANRHLYNTNPSENRIHKLRNEANWIVNKCLWNITKRFKILNKDRYNNNDWCQSLYWIDAIYRYIDIQKKFHNFGSYYDHALKQKINGTTKGFCSKYWDKINNINNDSFKKVVNALLPIIKQHKISVVMLEELKSMYGDKLKNSRDNRLYNLWPVGELKKFLEGVLKPYNIAVINVDEKNTSQIVNGNWAFRDKNILTDGKVVVHADEQAARNIAERGLTNHGNLFSLYMVNPIDNLWTTNSAWSKKENSKRERGFLTKLYGNASVVFVKDDNNELVKSDITLKTLKSLVKKKKSGKAKSSIMYRVHDVKWIDGDERLKLIDKISSEFLAIKNVSTFKTHK